jgi:hypothetical protein
MLLPLLLPLLLLLGRGTPEPVLLLGLLLPPALLLLLLDLTVLSSSGEPSGSGCV